MRPEQLRARVGRQLLALAFLAALSGCATVPSSARQTLREQVAVELTEVPFHPQRRYQCGPAALATVLNWSGEESTPDALTGALYIPAREGTLQTELVAQARRHGRLAYRVEPMLEALLAELEAGHPLLLLQNLGLSWSPTWHYAVLIGYDPAQEHFILRSGEHARLLMPAATFLKTWQRGGRWALLVLPPQELPSHATAEGVLDAAYALERLNPAAATQTYRAALARWPNEARLYLALANARYGSGDVGAAERVLRQGVEHGLEDAALFNNWAVLLSQLGHHDRAERAARRAVALGGDEQLVYRRTLREVRAARPPTAPP